MAAKKATFQEGDWIAVPLRRAGYALGLLARLHGKDTALGYFFGPKLTEVPTEQRTVRLGPADAVLVAKFGTVGISNGDWKVAFPSQHWRREDWPIPVFHRVEP